MADNENDNSAAKGRRTVSGKAGRRTLPPVNDDPYEVEEVPDPLPNARRVYALPQDLIERIVEFQRDKGYQSEVEAVRRLLDDALKYRDTTDKIVSRFMARLRSMRITSEVAKDILVAHPLISTLSFGQDYVSFVMKDKVYDITIYDTGAVSVARVGANPFDTPQYKWSTTTDDKFGPGRISFVSDEDDIPF